MKIIGLSGYARSGKDEAAKVLVEEFGFTRVAFADKLREFLYALNPEVAVRSNFTGYDINLEPRIETKSIYVQDVINAHGWDGYKETEFGSEIRRLLQRLGTEAGRNTLWDSIWIDAAFANCTADDRIVVTDVRFPNEAEAVKSRGGKVWRVMREGIGPANPHPSETSLDDWSFDKWIYNNFATVENYREAVKNHYLKDGRNLVG